MQPAFSSFTWMPASRIKPPSMPISPNSFSISTSFSPPQASWISFLMRVVLPAPKTPEKMSILVLFSAMAVHLSLWIYPMKICSNVWQLVCLTANLIITNLSRPAGKKTPTGRGPADRPALPAARRSRTEKCPPPGLAGGGKRISGGGAARAQPGGAGGDHLLHGAELVGQADQPSFPAGGGHRGQGEHVPQDDVLLPVGQGPVGAGVAQRRPRV